MKRQHRKPSKIKSPTGELFFKPTVQPKLNMGEVGDKYEVEADKMADAVVDKTATEGIQQKGMEEEIQQKPLAEGVTPWVQKKSVEEEPVQSQQEEEPVQSQNEQMTEEDKEAIGQMQQEGGIPVQHKKEEEPLQTQQEEENLQAKQEEEPLQSKEEEEAVQSKAPANQKAANIGDRLYKKRGKGRAMEPSVKHEMEKGFGADFSKVSIHTDAEAEQMSADINAQAFTNGHDIYFNAGTYNPKTKKGKHLLAHELAHTLQQKGVRPKTIQKKPSFSVSGPIQSIDMFDPSTAPAGDTSVIGETRLYVNGHDLSEYLKEKGPEAAINLLFPLPEYKKVGGECQLTNKDLKVNMESEYHILVAGPWVEKLSKNEVEKLMDGALKDEMGAIAKDGATVSIEGVPDDARLLADDVRAELQHVASDKCLFEKLIAKHQEEVAALPTNIPLDYGVFSSCEAKLEQLLHRSEYYNAFIEGVHADKRFYDSQGAQPHKIIPKVVISEDGTRVTIKLRFKNLDMERGCDQ